MQIDSVMCRTLREQGLPAINEALKALGMVATMPGSMKYGPDGIKAAMLVVPIANGQSGEVTVAVNAKAIYDSMTHMLGLPADSFGKGVLFSGKVYKITGMAGGRSSRVHVARQPDGKVFVMNVEQIKTGLAAAKSLSM